MAHRFISRYDIIKEAIFTERTTQLSEKEHVYTFRVATNANKVEIKRAIEEAFNVKVVDVRTVNVHSKRKLDRYRGIMGRTKQYKKALVRLAEGQTIQFA
ncbi:MAG: 50S ribosomal protein L23 [bacterium]|jgi:large subunit ribosomal protein L23